MNNLIQAYVSAHTQAWSASALRTEPAKLRAMVTALTGEPQALWAFLDQGNYGRYTRVTYWSRVVNFWDWMIDQGHKEGPNPYKSWRRMNARLFKHTYERRQPDISYGEAKRRIDTIGDREIREACQFLLEGATRYCELATHNPEERTVIGKGGKLRKIYTELVPRYQGGYHRIYRALRSIGLKPHDLRKLGVSKFRDAGLREEDLCEVMGWESFETARSYLKPKSQDEIERLIKAVR